MCRYWNKGFCKEGNKCQFVHPKEDCTKHINKEKCEDRQCEWRHRRYTSTTRLDVTEETAASTFTSTKEEKTILIKELKIFKSFRKYLSATNVTIKLPKSWLKKSTRIQNIQKNPTVNHYHHLFIASILKNLPMSTGTILIGMASTEEKLCMWRRW